MTNLERIRQMPVEELAKVLATSSEDHGICQNKQECIDLLDADRLIPDEWCIQCAKEWLEREAKE